MNTSQIFGQDDLQRFMRAALKSDGIDYRGNDALYAELDTEVKRLASDSDNAAKGFPWLLQTAHETVKLAQGQSVASQTPRSNGEVERGKFDDIAEDIVEQPSGAAEQRDAGASDTAQGAATIDADAILGLSDFAFCDAWRALSPEAQSAIGARGFERYRKLTEYINEGLDRAEREQREQQEQEPGPEGADAGAGAQHEQRQHEQSAGAQGNKRPDRAIATRLIEIGSEGQKLFHDERGDGYVCTEAGGASKTMRLKGREFRRWLAGKYWSKYESAPNGEAIQNALNVLEAKANHDGEEIELHNRFAVKGATVYIDLCNEKWQAVRVTAEGWSIIPCPPLFRRYVHQRPLPIPQSGGSLDRLDGFLNIKSPDDRQLVRAWLVASFMENVPRPALTFHGPQGSAKTTGGRVLRRLIDPSVSECLGFPKDDMELAQLLDHHAVPLLDNVRRVGDQAADTLCRAVTGGAFSKRELFTDAEDVIFKFRRALILNGINIPTHAPDLLDRMLLIELERVPSSSRRTEREFWAEFDAEQPALFGALLDSVAAMLRTSFAVANLPRMADFAELGARWAEGSGLGGGQFLDIYTDNVSRQTEEALESDSVGCALRDLVKEKRSFRGTPSALLKLLNDRREKGEHAPSDWPKRAESLSKRINVLQTTLHDSGIEVSRGTEAKVRFIAVATADNWLHKPSQPSQPSQPSPTSPENTPEARRFDGSDARNGSSGQLSAGSSLPKGNGEPVE